MTTKAEPNVFEKWITVGDALASVERWAGTLVAETVLDDWTRHGAMKDSPLASAAPCKDAP